MAIYYIPCHITITCNLPIETSSVSEAYLEAEDYIDEYLEEELPESCSVISSEVRAINSDSYKLPEEDY